MAGASPGPTTALAGATHSLDGSGSSPRTIWLRRSSTSAARRSANAVRASVTRAPTASASGLDSVLQSRAGAETRHAAGGDLDPLAGLRVHALAGATLSHGELAEAGEADLSAAAQSLLDHLEDRVHRVPGLRLAQVGTAGDLVYEFLLGHVILLVFRLGI